ENHEVYAGKDDYLLQKIPPPKFPLDDQLGYVKQFAEGVNMPVYFMLAPNSAAIHTDKLPNYAPVPEQQITIQQACSQLSDLISCVHLYDTLKDRHDEYIYYRTDHHWTTLGAYYAYETFAKQAGLKPFAQSDFKMERVS